jgi:RasGEF domain
MLFVHLRQHFVLFFGFLFSKKKHTRFFFSKLKVMNKNLKRSLSASNLQSIRKLGGSGGNAPPPAGSAGAVQKDEKSSKEREKEDEKERERQKLKLKRAKKKASKQQSERRHWTLRRRSSTTAKDHAKSSTALLDLFLPRFEHDVDDNDHNESGGVQRPASARAKSGSYIDKTSSSSFVSMSASSRDARKGTPRLKKSYTLSSVSRADSNEQDSPQHQHHHRHHRRHHRRKANADSLSMSLQQPISEERQRRRHRHTKKRHQGHAHVRHTGGEKKQRTAGDLSSDADSMSSSGDDDGDNDSSSADDRAAADASGSTTMLRRRAATSSAASMAPRLKPRASIESLSVPKSKAMAERSRSAELPPLGGIGAAELPDTATLSDIVGALVKFMMASLAAPASSSSLAAAAKKSMQQVDSFLLTLPLISTPVDVLRSLAERYRLASFDSANEIAVQTAVVALMTLWLDRYYERDFAKSPAVMDALMHFIDYAEASGDESGASTLRQRSRSSNATAAAAAAAAAASSSAAAATQSPDAFGVRSRSVPSELVRLAAGLPLPLPSVSSAANAAKSPSAAPGGASEVAAAAVALLRRRRNSDGASAADDHIGLSEQQLRPAAAKLPRRAAQPVPALVPPPSLRPLQLAAITPAKASSSSSSSSSATTLDTGAVVAAATSDFDRMSPRGAALRLTTRSKYKQPAPIAFGVSLSPHQLAIYLTVADLELFRKIGESELVERGLGGGNESESAATSTPVDVRRTPLDAFVQRFNLVSYWVSSRILSCEDPDDRAGTVRCFILMAERLAKLNNFNTLMAALAGLNISAVSRLKTTWALLSVKSRGALEVLEALMDVASNYGRYRERLAKLRASNTDCLPYMGVYLRDLFFIEEANDTHTGDNKINLGKVNMVTSIVRSIKHFQRAANYHQLGASLDAALVTFVRHLRDAICDPNTLYDRSLLVEPRKVAHISPRVMAAAKRTSPRSDASGIAAVDATPASTDDDGTASSPLSSPRSPRGITAPSAGGGMPRLPSSSELSKLPSPPTPPTRLASSPPSVAVIASAPEPAAAVDEDEARSKPSPRPVAGSTILLRPPRLSQNTLRPRSLRLSMMAADGMLVGALAADADDSESMADTSQNQSDDGDRDGDEKVEGASERQQGCRVRRLASRPSSDNNAAAAIDDENDDDDALLLERQLDLVDVDPSSLTRLELEHAFRQLQRALFFQLTRQ